MSRNSCVSVLRDTNEQWLSWALVVSIRLCVCVCVCVCVCACVCASTAAVERQRALEDAQGSFWGGGGVGWGGVQRIKE